MSKLINNNKENAKVDKCVLYLFHKYTKIKVTLLFISFVIAGLRATTCNHAVTVL